MMRKSVCVRKHGMTSGREEKEGGHMVPLLASQTVLMLSSPPTMTSV